MQYTVKQLSELTGVSPYTIRFYAREGLLPGFTRNEAGVRFFSERDAVLLDLIECLKSCDMTIAEIKQYIDWTVEGDCSIPSRLELLTKQEEVLRTKLDKLKESLDVISYKKWQYTVGNEAGTMSILASMTEEDVPAEILDLQKKLLEKGHIAALNPKLR